MEVSDKKIKEITRKIMISRMRLLVNNGFYGLLLMHMKISLGTEFENAWTDCKERIYFNPDFVEKLSDRELDYTLMHLVIHAALHHGNRRGDFDEETFDQAADIVVNSNIYHSNGDNEDAIVLRDYGGVQPHTAPDGSEGYNYSVEELYNILIAIEAQAKINGDKHPDDFFGGGQGDGDGKGGAGEGTHRKGGWDTHISSAFLYSDEDEEVLVKQQWESNIRKTIEAVSVRDSSKQRGLLPMFAQRIVDEFKKAQTDWRQLLNEFIQDEINDYSFVPPDRRMADGPFFLPDYNERDYKPGNVLFMIDTSGSMSDSAITECYSEIKGAIDQFNGKFGGLLGFFDAAVIEPIPFEDEESLRIIRPMGGGGTSFHVIFEYIQEKMIDELPTSIVILTDGYAPFPNKEEALGIPVLWIINNEEVAPPWGVVARIVQER